MTTFDNQWDKVHETRNWGKYPAEELIRFMARNYFTINPRSSIRVLDLGCGTGANSWFLAREGFDTIAFDGAFAAVKKAKELCDELCKPVSFLQSDAGILPFIDESFDAVVDIGAISANSTNGIRQILKEIYRVLKPGGKIFSSVLFTRSTTGYKQGKQVDSASFRNIETGPLADLGTIHFFSRNEIKSLWNKAGFTIPQIDIQSRTDRGGKIKVSFYTAQAEKGISLNDRA